jgi:hypothetical protein
MPKRIEVVLTETQKEELETVRHHHAKPYMRERAAAVLKVAQGELLSTVADYGLLTRHEPETVHGWIKTYLASGLAGWTIRSGRGRKPAFFPSGQR